MTTLKYVTPEEYVWASGNGEVKLKDMTDEHIRNCIKLLERFFRDAWEAHYQMSKAVDSLPNSPEKDNLLLEVAKVKESIETETDKSMAIIDVMKQVLENRNSSGN